MSLGLDRTVDRTLLEPLALPPVPLPDDWQDRRDFLRVHNLCVQNGYDWPLQSEVSPLPVRNTRVLSEGRGIPIGTDWWTFDTVPGLVWAAGSVDAWRGRATADAPQ